MEWLAIIAFYAAVFVVIVVVHESGHYLAGRLAGIARSNMRISLWSFPQHVALRTDDGWVSPKNIDRYVLAMSGYLPTTAKMFLYVAGGFVLETVFTLALGLGITAGGFPKVAYAIVLLSTFGVLWWLVLDTMMVLRGRHAGDFSGLWALNKPGAICFIITILGGRGCMLWHLKG